MECELHVEEEVGGLGCEAGVTRLCYYLGIWKRNVETEAAKERTVRTGSGWIYVWK